MKDLREYCRPSTPEEAVAIKREYGTRAVYLAGGSDLLVSRPSGVEMAIDIRFAGMDYVRREEAYLAIGGSALLCRAEREVRTFASGALWDAFRETAPWLIRNAATVAGNIANASPTADSVPALLVLDAELLLLGQQEESMPLEDVFVAPHRTVLGDRLIGEIRVPARNADKRAVSVKFSRSKSDIAQVNLAVSLRVEDGAAREVRIALGAVAPTPTRVRRAEEALEGRRVTDDVLAEVERIVREEVRPISDWRASAEYRRRMSGVLVRRALEKAVGAGQWEVVA